MCLCGVCVCVYVCEREWCVCVVCVCVCVCVWCVCVHACGCTHVCSRACIRVCICMPVCLCISLGWKQSCKNIHISRTLPKQPSGYGLLHFFRSHVLTYHNHSSCVGPSSPTCLTDLLSKMPLKKYDSNSNSILSKNVYLSFTAFRWIACKIFTCITIIRL